MAQAYYYSSVAGQFTLTIAVTGGATILNVNTTTGMPGGLPFKLVLEPGTVREEIVKVTSIGGLALTVVRGWDGTPATSHDAGSAVRHALSAEDLTLSRIHEAATTGIHGVTSGLVGVSDTQSISNKTLVPNVSSGVAALVKGLSGQTGDLIQGQDNLGNVLFKVSATGDVTAPNLTTKFASLDGTDATHTANIATNTANISANTANIATNTSNISANTSAISALQAAAWNKNIKDNTGASMPGGSVPRIESFPVATTTINDGSGNGYYDITFPTAFASPPCVIATTSSGSQVAVVLGTVPTTTGVRLFWKGEGVKIIGAHVIAIGW